ncbi:hypothetical protein PV336_16235 [Streptomyces sp. MI02-2A]|uniref:hypothetical protein n=1 Tax=Streptomyces sp. MI02-2A TaxID=3028688 RepID=UPI0029A54F96|nr:hypothetical protein [Streptomyces sp. MI02-2A]MDX3260770.1 hypothetical protein [Streptomyces sp. MI02-2A]
MNLITTDVPCPGCKALLTSFDGLSGACGECGHQLDDETGTVLLAAVLAETVSDVYPNADSGGKPAKVCRTCRRALERKVEAGTGAESWHHHNQDIMSGHKPIPVDADKVDMLGRCDFCNSDLGEEVWVLPCRDFIAGINPLTGQNQGYAGDWAACGTCAPLVDKNQWNALLRRVQKGWEDDHGIPAPEEKVTAWRVLYRLLRKNIKGAIYLSE